MHAQVSPENRQLRGIPADRMKLIESIAAAAPKKSAILTAAARSRYLHEYFRGVGEEDLAQRPPEELAAAAMAHLEFGTERVADQTRVRVFNADREHDGFDSPHTLVMVITDDMPFLVDSLNVAFSAQEIAVHLIVHPVLAVHRDAQGRLTGINGGKGSRNESWQLIEIDRQSDPARLAQLQERLACVLLDTRRAVEDWRPMRAMLRRLIGELEKKPPKLPQEELSEGRSLLEWMESGHFVLLGYRYYRLERDRAEDRLAPDEKTSLGVLRGKSKSGTTVLRGEVRTRARDRELLILTKANSHATVHRGSYLDYVGVKTFSARGEVDGEHRFLGLWTSTAYHLNPREIPVLRRKVQQIIDYFGLDPGSHDGKAVLNVLETYPRDELFQAPVEDLIRITRGVVNLYERRTVRLLARRDPYHRFYSCLIYVPRDRYSTEVRRRIEHIVLEGFAGRSVDTQVQISADSSHARVHAVVHTRPDARHAVDLPAIEARVAEATATWADRLRVVLGGQRDAATAQVLANRYRATFPADYQAVIEPGAALGDLDDLEALRSAPQSLRLNLYRPAQGDPARIHFKIAKLGEPVPISDILPMLENFGLRVIAERPYELAWPEGGSAWIQDFELEHRDRLALDIAAVQEPFKEGFAAAWRGEVENDGFNRLLLGTGLRARQIVVLRAYCRYLLQTGVPFSQAYMERALARNSAVARHLVALFEAQFSLVAPRGKAKGKGEPQVEKLIAQVREGLDAVTSLDEDRILRSYLSVIRATLRTNFFQPDEKGEPKSYVSFKLDPHQIADLPLPKPKFEIFVYSPRVEGVHLRMGYVARGGIRWSDRREDFRTEILGLMKAQNVKNTVIVPVGAKGGFVPKRAPTGSREEIQADGIACYQTFIRGLLDVTDNIRDGHIAPPANVVRRDGDDAYLVVAADKGTATFSDIANAISIEYGFWLGDAFASGGSAGYDHKKMGITARGAWECVKRHFRELSMDIQTQDFTCAGIGDMAGDVFGNGMLLSRHTKLLAAFNHLHIFLDPSPNPEASFKERERLFALPRSSWEDYDRKLISKGGGIFSRSAKSITLSSAAQAMLGLDTAEAAPTDVIRAILRMPVDLLWNGGIGTYVKASSETHGQVGDRANDALRIDGRELRAKVVGEGGNLGLSQRGRIEYALAGGRLNTDFIDNSAGVNTSDVEVNIKILLNPLVAERELNGAERNKLLARMTPEVAELVLRNNYLQGQALSTLELQSAARLAEYQHLIRSLERSGDLNRAIEFLPTDDELAERRKAGKGLTRPELAIVLAYSKIWLSNHLLASDVPEDTYLSSELERYFPGPVSQRFPKAIQEHRLRREIIATATTNSLVNRMGPTFMARAQEDTGCGPAEIARAYTAAREIFDMRKLWSEIETLDNRAPARLQYEMMYQTSRLLRHVTYWLLTYCRRNLHVDQAVAQFRSGARELEEATAQVLVGPDRERYQSILKQHIEAGVPAALAARIASLAPLNAALDIVQLATAHKARVAEVAHIYFEVGHRIGLDWLRERVENLNVEGPWQAVARGALRDHALRIHRQLTERVLKRGGRGTPETRVAAWVESAGESLAHWQRTLTDMRAAGAADFATLSVGIEAVRKLAE